MLHGLRHRLQACHTGIQREASVLVARIARRYYAEALALLQEQVTTVAVLVTCLRAAGFRKDPCELMDLIVLDTNFALTQPVYAANF